MKRNLIWALTVLLLPIFFALSALEPVLARPGDSHSHQEVPTETPTTTPLTPAELINAVNNLRTSRGLNALTTHPILMQVAADQANALAASEGAVGHQRPCGITLGQDLLMRGFPLWGDLSLDGYRSENWGIASTVQDAIAMWLSDEPHTDTMLDPNRSDIGAAVAISDQVYVVLETALRTNSGLMQSGAYPILTGIPMTVSACSGQATQYAENSKLPQYSIPVVQNTALPNGDVIHEVKYGQTLWSIAIQYGTRIEQIRRLNNLNSDTLQTGQKLVVMRGATQPATDSGLTPTLPAANVAYDFIITPIATYTPTASASQSPPSADNFVQQNGVVIVALIVSFAALLAGLGVFGRRKSEKKNDRPQT